MRFAKHPGTEQIFFCSRILPLLWGCWIFLAFGTADPAAADVGKRVLIVHSFGSAAPPFTTHSIAFETELTEQLGQDVELDEVSLDHARFAGTNMEEALVEYLQKRQAEWQPDLVVPVGSPAGVFVEKYRDRLFPQTTVLYAGMDRRRLGADALNNAAFVGESFDLPGFVEDILQVAPGTTNIVCVIGASQVERYWTAAFQSDFAQFTNRVRFTWLNDLPFDRMLDRLKKLPPHSYIFLILLMKDAAGVTLNADEALRRISEVANAPVNSIYEEQLGKGIVGGRLYRARFEGLEGARIAVRILRGEAASNFPPEIVGPIGAQYDWRQLRRWHISEDRLPPGSIVKYREPSIWERNRLLMIGGLSLVLVESLLIAGQRVNLIQRRKAERALRESERRFRTVADSAPVFIWMTGADRGCVFLNRRWLEFTGRQVEQEIGFGWTANVHPDDLFNCLQVYHEASDARRPFTMEYRLRRLDGQYRWFLNHGVPRYDAEKQFLGYIGSCVDVTERRESEAEARGWQLELAHVSRLSTLWALAGSLAHELRQPLAAIVNSAEAGWRFMDGKQKNEAEVRDALIDISEQGQRAGDIITEMRAMLKKDPGPMTPQDMNLKLRAVVEMVGADLVTRHVTPELRLDPLLPPVMGHGVQLRQVVLNLVMNACDAMAEEPAGQRTLTIESKRVGTDEVEVSVSDTGPGFSEEMLRQPFEFFRTTKAKGLGLGLAICRSIITAHDGHIELANNRDRGATIKFTLPAKVSHESRANSVHRG